jgi:ubiquinone/menaquinone biosynthesis C-methylase UbiE
MLLTDDFIKFLACPDDGTAIVLRDRFLECPKCRRKYPILGNNFVEILPVDFPGWSLKENEPKRAEEMYLQEFKRSFSWNVQESGWGDLLNASAGTRAFYKAEMQKVLQLIDPSVNSVAVDVSGVVGNYAIFLANKLKIVINCDLHTPSIITAYERKKNNMACVRTPYLRLPFASNVFDHVICTDTLIRGWNHEVKLLKEILRIMKISGIAFVDFHNLKWFRKNRNICAYKAGSVRRLLNEVGIKQYTLYPFGYIPTKLVFKEFFYPYLDNLFSFLLPPNRHIVVFAKA